MKEVNCEDLMKAGRFLGNTSKIIPSNFRKCNLINIDFQKKKNPFGELIKTRSIYVYLVVCNKKGLIFITRFHLL